MARKEVIWNQWEFGLARHPRESVFSGCFLVFSRKSAICLGHTPISPLEFVILHLVNQVRMLGKVVATILVLKLAC